MKEIATLLAAADRLFTSGEEGVLVTLVHTKGSTYRRPGARMLVLPGNQTVGTISGGCLEPTVARQAWELTRATPRVAFLFESAPEDDAWGPASGCHGVLTLLAERISARERHPALDALAVVVRSHRPMVLRHDFVRSTQEALIPVQSHDPQNPLWPHEVEITLANAASRWVEHGDAAAFLEYLAPPVHLLLCGGGDDAQPVARLAHELAWSVDLLDTRARLATRDRFPTAAAVTVGGAEKLSPLLHPHTAAVLMTHRFTDDLAFLEQLLNAQPPLPYLGILGPRRRTERLLHELAARGCIPSPRQLKNLRSPIGLDLGASSPETIALSIIAEIQATLAARDAHPLSTRTGPIHAPLPPTCEMR
jgi:xanthine/CO dehydrogenase XdhC/CoxF family maturation factor